MEEKADKLFNVFDTDADVESWNSDTFAWHLARVLKVEHETAKGGALREWCRNNNMTGKILFSQDTHPWIQKLQRDLEILGQEGFRSLSGSLRALRMESQCLVPPLCGLKRLYHLDFAYTEDHQFLLHRGHAAYVNPAGWTRVAIYPDLEEDDQEEVFKTWHVAYHGTPAPNLRSIISNGLLCPGAKIGDEVVKQIHTGAGGKKCIYVSPSIWYSSHWVYTQCPSQGYTGDRIYDQVKEQYNPRTREGEDGQRRYVHYVFQVRVRPGSYRVQGNTFHKSEFWGDPTQAPVPGENGNRQVPYDLSFGAQEVEWLVDDPTAVRVTGLMFRETKVEPKQEARDRFKANKARWEERRAAVEREGEGAGRFNCFTGKEDQRSRFQWQWNSSPASGGTLSSSDDAPWSDYNAAQSMAIERAYVQGQETAYLGQMGAGGSHYFVRLRDKVQINAGNDQNWRQRKVRRVLAP